MADPKDPQLQKIPTHALVSMAPMAAVVSVGEASDGGKVVCLRIECPVGSFVFSFDPDDSDALAVDLAGAGPRARSSLELPT